MKEPQREQTLFGLPAGSVMTSARCTVGHAIHRIEADLSNDDSVRGIRESLNQFLENEDDPERRNQINSLIERLPIENPEVSLAPPPVQAKKGKVTPHVLHPEINSEYRTNFRIENDAIGVGTPLERFYNNVHIHAEISEYEFDELEADEEDLSIPADPDVRNFSFTVVDGKIYYRENSRMNPVDVSATAESRIKGMIAIRDCVRTLIEWNNNFHDRWYGRI